MSKVVDEVSSANADYVANFGDKGDLPMPPGRHMRLPIPLYLGNLHLQS